MYFVLKRNSGSVYFEGPISQSELKDMMDDDGWDKMKFLTKEEASKIDLSSFPVDSVLIIKGDVYQPALETVC